MRSTETTDAHPKDSISTISAIGLLAYASADIGHHALGHGAACLAAGGRIVALSSIVVDCTVTSAAIDLAGPLANLLIGLVASLAAHVVTRMSSAMRLFCALVAAFNLLWFAMQLVFSAATKTDDWAWAIHEFHVTSGVCAGMIVVGALIYVATIRSIAAQLLALAHSPTRVGRIVLTVWLTAGGFACATATFDHHALAALLWHAAPQSLLNSIGLVFVPTLTAKWTSTTKTSPALDLAIPWIIAAAIVGAASIYLLGPGMAVAV